MKFGFVKIAGWKLIEIKRILNKVVLGLILGIVCVSIIFVILGIMMGKPIVVFVGSYILILYGIVYLYLRSKAKDV